jgi:excisionase family DNA binding protein
VTLVWAANHNKHNASYSIAFVVFTEYAASVRTHTYDRIIGAEAEELLTTGEAAALLNSSRQHVVNLCERGELPYTTVGTHRRIRRADVEALRARTQRLTRDQRRSLWLAYAVGGRIVADPHRAGNVARRNLERMRASSRGQARRWLDEWESLLNGPIDELLAMLVSPSPKGRELRQNAPFAGLLGTAERAEVLDAWKDRGSKDLP